MRAKESPCGVATAWGPWVSAPRSSRQKAADPGSSVQSSRPVTCPGRQQGTGRCPGIQRLEMGSLGVGTTLSPDGRLQTQAAQSRGWRWGWDVQGQKKGPGPRDWVLPSHADSSSLLISLGSRPGPPAGSTLPLVLRS